MREVEQPRSFTSGICPQRADVRSVIIRRRDEQKELEPRTVAQDITKNMVRQAEINRARIFEMPGEMPNFTNWADGNQVEDVVGNLVGKLPSMTLDLSNDYVHSAMVDENYLVLGNHIEDSIKIKIVKGE